MNTTGIGAAHSFQPVSPFTAHSKPAVGLESSENKDQTLPPVEESANADRLRERRGQRIGALNGERDGAASGDHSEQQAPTSEEQSQQLGDAGQSVSSNATLRPIAIIDTGPEHPTTPPAKALDQFQQAAQPPIPTGLLFDQET